jgi:hypothetical protein
MWRIQCGQVVAGLVHALWRKLALTRAAVQGDASQWLKGVGVSAMAFQVAGGWGASRLSTACMHCIHRHASRLGGLLAPPGREHTHVLQQGQHNQLSLQGSRSREAQGLS